MHANEYEHFLQLTATSLPIIRTRIAINSRYITTKVGSEDCIYRLTFLVYKSFINSVMLASGPSWGLRPSPPLAVGRWKLAVSCWPLASVGSSVPGPRLPSAPNQINYYHHSRTTNTNTWKAKCMQWKAAKHIQKQRNTMPTTTTSDKYAKQVT